ncbi:MAG: hypothetical protein MUC78_12890 [Bacteroidales bacterium]|nr:hypothetical protein [Bacteroidales bacterium]
MMLSVNLLNITGQGIRGKKGYLFAHMKGNDYGRLYYSVSEDGLTWSPLNGGKRVNDDYRGHPDICRGHDGRFYMLGVEVTTKRIPIWVSSDLLSWKIEGYVPLEVFNDYPSPSYKAADSYQGAPKMFFDKDSCTYIITWHCPDATIPRENFTGYWCSMRTFYIVSSDLQSFSRPARLFNFEMGTIDVIIRKEGSLYYAFLKDECEATAQWPTGKSIRVSVSQNLTGPYSYPSQPVSPSYHEAPAVIPKPDNAGWYMYYEQYPGVQFGVSEAPSMAGPWFKVWGSRVRTPEGARHGCMIALTEEQYDALHSYFDSGNKEVTLQDTGAWLYVSFKDVGEKGIFFALSKDAKHWSELNSGKPWLVPDSSVGGMRDPYITRGPDSTFHMVWTCGRRKIGYSSSTDLVNWSPQRAIPVDAANENVQNTWAPELYFDETSKEWVVFWSSTIDGMLTETQGQVENNRNHRIFYMKTRDFLSFSDPKLFFDPGYPVIDATILPVADSLIMVFKDERRWPLHKQLRSASSPSIEGPWSVYGDTITAPWTEGPSLIKMGKEYILFYDSYSKPQHMGASMTTDFIAWKDITGEMVFPDHFKHGSFLLITREEKERIVSS